MGISGGTMNYYQKSLSHIKKWIGVATIGMQLLGSGCRVFKPPHDNPLDPENPENLKKITITPTPYAYRNDTLTLSIRHSFWECDLWYNWSFSGGDPISSFTEDSTIKWVAKDVIPLGVTFVWVFGYSWDEGYKGLLTDTVILMKNHAPSIPQLSIYPSDSVIVGDTVYFKASSTDIEGDAITYHWGPKRRGEWIDTIGSEIRWLPTEPDTYIIFVLAIDKWFGSAREDTTIIVTE
jgi:hypothetical protein